MKKSFQKSLIAASVGAVMFAAAGTASANSLLFPYFTTASGAQSVLSISNAAGAGAAYSTFAAASKETLHYVYNYTQTNVAPGPGTSCIHFDGNGIVTPNDVMQHSIASPAAGGFGKAVGTDASTPFYLPLRDTTGFLTVSTKTSAAGNITGDMAIVDPATGLVVSYAGINNSIADTTTTGEGDFSFITDKTFDLSVYPAAQVNTTFYTLVVGNMYPAISTNRNWGGVAKIGNGGFVYDNDEQPFSGVQSKTLSCVGPLTASDFQTSAQAAAVGPNGGLIHVTSVQQPISTTSVPPVADTSTGLVIFKLQAVQASVGAPFAGKQFAHRMSATAAPVVGP